MTDINSNEFTPNNLSSDGAAENAGTGASESAPSFQLGPPSGVQPRSATTRSGQLSASQESDDSASPVEEEPVEEDSFSRSSGVDDELVNDELMETEEVSSSIPAIPQTHPFLVQATSTPLEQNNTSPYVEDDVDAPTQMTAEEARLFDTDEPGYSMSALSPTEQAYMAGDTSLSEEGTMVTERALSTDKTKNSLANEPEEEIDPNAPTNDRELDLFEHLRELRARLLYCVYAILVAMCVTWNYGNQVSDWFAAPIREALRLYGPKGSTIQAIEPTESFMVYLQITAVSAILIVMPFLLFQLWRFIEPAMTRREKRFTKFLVPFSVALFFAGCGLGYYVSPLFFRFFLQFQPANMPANYAYQTSVVLLAKMLLVFGVCFQVPVVTIFLTKAGIVTRNVLIEYWRHAVIVIFTVVAVLTPTWDPLTLMICAIPPTFLYIFSIWLVKWL